VVVTHVGVSEKTGGGARSKTKDSETDYGKSTRSVMRQRRPTVVHVGVSEKTGGGARSKTKDTEKDYSKFTKNVTREPRTNFSGDIGASDKKTGKGGDVSDIRKDTRDVPTLPLAHVSDIGQDSHKVPSHSLAHASDIGQDSHKVPSHSLAHTSDIGQDSHNIPSHSLAHVSDIGQDSRNVSSRSLVHVSDIGQDIHNVPSCPIALMDEDDNSSDDAAGAGDVTIMPDKGKGREIYSDQGSTTQSLLSGIDLEPFRPRVSDYDPTMDYKLNAFPRYQGDTFGTQ